MGSGILEQLKESEKSTNCIVGQTDYDFWKDFVVQRKKKK
jgi:hypothetical protein